jgi:hypothetical protein
LNSRNEIAATPLTKNQKSPSGPDIADASDLSRLSEIAAKKTVFVSSMLQSPELFEITGCKEDEPTGKGSEANRSPLVKNFEFHLNRRHTFGRRN